jgi:hypothetical protein
MNLVPSIEGRWVDQLGFGRYGLRVYTRQTVTFERVRIYLSARFQLQLDAGFLVPAMSKNGYL